MRHAEEHSAFGLRALGIAGFRVALEGQVCVERKRHRGRWAGRGGRGSWSPFGVMCAGSSQLHTTRVTAMAREGAVAVKGKVVVKGKEAWTLFACAGYGLVRVEEKVSSRVRSVDISLFTDGRYPTCGRNARNGPATEANYRYNTRSTWPI